MINLILFLNSCALSPAEPSRYLQDTYRLEEGEFFQRVWRQEKFDISQYKKIAIAPISTTFLRSLGWWDMQNQANYTDAGRPGFQPRGNIKTGKQLAKYFEGKMVEAFSKTPNNSFQLVDFTQADEGTIILQVALVEIVPIKKYMLGLGLVGDGSLKGGTVAIEGKLLQGKTYKILAMFTDRQMNNREVKYSDKTKLSWYSHTKPIMDAWSKLFVRLANRWEHQQHENNNQ